jgi:hypothetical protein
VTLPDLTGSPIVRRAVHLAVETSFPHRSKQLTRSLSLLMSKALKALVDEQVGPYYPNLSDELKAETDKYITQQREAADAVLADLIEAEKESVQTLNSYYGTMLSKARADMQLIAAGASQRDQFKASRKASDLNDCSVDFLERAAKAQQQGQSNDEHAVCELQLICHAYVKVVRKSFVDTAYKQARMHLGFRLQQGLYDRMLIQLGGEGSEDLLGYLMAEDPAVALRRAQINISLERFLEHLPKLEGCCRF